MVQLKTRPPLEMRAEYAQELERLADWFRNPERRDTELASALGLAVAHFGGVLADNDSQVVLRHVGFLIAQTVKAFAHERELIGRAEFAEPDSEEIASVRLPKR